MGPQVTITEGSLTIEVYGGHREIGGNCIVVKDRERKVVFDNGIRFSALRRYYRGRVQPRGISELRSLGIIPPREVFEGVDAVYISHFHLDHLGLLGAMPPGSRVYVPSIDLLKVIEEWHGASPTWLAELPHRLHVEIHEVKPYVEDELGVTPIPVSHSAYPSFAFTYRGYEKSAFYSGDLRISSPLGPGMDTLSNIGKALGDGSIDVALVEGTNVGGVETPIGPEEFESMCNTVLMGGGLAVISIDPLDFEMLAALTRLASISGRSLVVASQRLVDALPQWLELLESIGGSGLAVATELERPVPFPARFISVRQEVFSEPGDYILVQDPFGFLDMLRQVRLWRGELPSGTTAVLTTPEPLEAETEVEEETLALWLYSLGIPVYRLRLSGHYYPHQLRELIEAVRPGRIIPIHTKHPSLMLKLSGA